MSFRPWSKAGFTPQYYAMKLTALILCATALFYAVAAQHGPAATPGVQSPAAATSFSWSNTLYDFGSIRAGTPVSYEFRFVNIGAAPLVITSAKASCGCTMAAYTREPVEKGKAGVVRVRYDAAQPGKFSKTVVVTANTAETPFILTIQGEVLSN